MKKRVLLLNSGSTTLKDGYVDSNLESMQELVDGYISYPVLSSDYDRLGIDTCINDEGKLIELEPSCVIVNNEDNRFLDYVAGNIVFTAHDNNGDMIDLTDEQARFVRQSLGQCTLTKDGKLIPVLKI